MEKRRLMEQQQDLMSQTHALISARYPSSLTSLDTSVPCQTSRAIFPPMGARAPSPTDVVPEVPSADNLEMGFAAAEKGALMILADMMQGAAEKRVSAPQYSSSAALQAVMA